MTEKWKDVVGYENHYQVSSLGNVRSVPRKVGYKTFGRLRNMKGKAMSQFLRAGYRSVRLCKDNRPRIFSVHRLVAEAFIGPASGMIVHHVDGDKLNNNVENLKYMEIEAHSSRHNSGRISAKRKFSKDDIEHIRKLIQDGKTQTELAKQYGVSQTTIWRIKEFKVYS